MDDPKLALSDPDRGPGPTMGSASGGVGRLQALAARSPAVRARVDELIALARRGLPGMAIEDGFAQTVRAADGPVGSMVRPEGENLRYAAIVALGAAQVDEEQQRQILSGSTAATLVRRVVQQAGSSSDLGAVALAVWVAAEGAGFLAADLLERLRAALTSDRPLSTVECAWALTAALAVRHLTETDALSRRAAARLQAAQGAGGLFPHMLPARASGRFRAHVGCFADQVYPIQALARFSAALGDAAALAAANACAARICACQGPAGQWWWHYDIRDGRVVEGYPVYSVHQHAMAPMALLDLWEAGGADHWPSIVKGLAWLKAPPEVGVSLVCDRRNVIWRKVGRRESRKAVRSISAVTTALKAGFHVPGLDLLFPPTRIDYECRPYELGWLIYAWKNNRRLLQSEESGRAARENPQWPERNL
ncbi:hypothetical protein [Microvirga terricola]|uniref:Uncharacterized protein n=1 Tax=Microvirga terricola TaxID=2719797 RepID=A0ABX0V7G6_9HYPH|nr:hypothetical protein [Microvirga terricola]NIX75688.1 hypothetical protein [Microvirga terricola]